MDVDIFSGSGMQNSKYEKACTKINRLLEQAGWLFFENNVKSANIQVESNVKITQ